MQEQPLTELLREGTIDRRPGVSMNSMTAAVLVDVLEAANRHEEKPLEVRVVALEVAHRIALADLEAERKLDSKRMGEAYA